jgi:hypothetical protein
MADSDKYNGGGHIIEALFLPSIYYKFVQTY